MTEHMGKIGLVGKKFLIKIDIMKKHNEIAKILTREGCLIVLGHVNDGKGIRARRL